VYYFLPKKSIFACISTYIHYKIFPCEGSNPARGLKHPNVIPHFFKNFFGIWVAKKPDISGFFLHVILLVMLIWLRRLDLNQRPSGYELPFLCFLQSHRVAQSSKNRHSSGFYNNVQNCIFLLGLMSTLMYEHIKPSFSLSHLRRLLCFICSRYSM